MDHVINPVSLDFASFSVEKIRMPAPDWGCEQRARLLWQAFDAGLAPVHALDQAREMWAFLRGPEADQPRALAEEAAVSERLRAGVVGIALSEGGLWRRVDHDGATLHVDYATFRDHPVLSRIGELRLEDDSEMVRIPRFWLRSERRGDERIWWISPWPREGFRLHPAFAKAEGGASAFIWIGKDLASRSEEGESLTMKARRRPWTGLTIREAREGCQTLGEGWRLWSVYDLAAVQLLALIDKGAPIGGVVGIALSEGGLWRRVLPAEWRGIHDLWGDVWQFTDGLRINAWGGIEIWDDRLPGGDLWTDTGVAYGPGAGDGFPTAFHEERGEGFDLSAIFIPSRVTGGPEKAATKDHVWGCGGDRGGIALSGGSWISRQDSGLFSLSLGCRPGHANSNVGFRPVFAD